MNITNDKDIHYNKNISGMNVHIPNNEASKPMKYS